MDWAAAIDLSIYSRPRVFRQPVLDITEGAGVSSVLWSFLFGPFFFWKKRARVEAFLMALSAMPLLQASHVGHKYSVGFAEIPYLSPVLWAGFSALAPVLLVMHYRRTGWIEIP